MAYTIPTLPLKTDLETFNVLKQTIASANKLGELKGTVKSVPNASIIINTLALQEAKESSAIESIITTQDELYKAELFVQHLASPAAKEVQTYAEALKSGYEEVREHGLLTNNTIINICRRVKMNDAGFRLTPGTTLINQSTNQIVYEPPQNIDEINKHMNNLEKFINNNELSNLHPLVKMAIIHHQFESIHPFGDGNGRTGRIINILYLVQQKLLDIPVLYLSRYIIKNKASYYTLLQTVRDKNEWEEWILFMLKGVEETSSETIRLIEDIKSLMFQFKYIIRNKLSKIYSQDLLNNLFRHPYTKIEFVMNELKVSRPTASSYLTQLERIGLIKKLKLGRDNFYINEDLYNLLMNEFHESESSSLTIESINRK
jgi:Fic family protein